MKLVDLLDLGEQVKVLFIIRRILVNGIIGSIYNEKVLRYGAIIY